MTGHWSIETGDMPSLPENIRSKFVVRLVRNGETIAERGYRTPLADSDITHVVRLMIDELHDSLEDALLHPDD